MMDNMPIPVDTELHLRSRDKEVPTVTVKILGARHGEFIIIDKPVHRISDRFSVEVEGDVMCWFSHEGVMYGFQSRIIEKLERHITLVDYPMLVQTRKIRKHHRIELAVPASLSVEGVKKAVKVSLEDISEGGCNLAVPSLVPVAQNIGCRLDFKLPEDQGAIAVKGEVQRVDYNQEKKTASLGVRFDGPPEELQKITSFCRFHLLFE